MSDDGGSRSWTVGVGSCCWRRLRRRSDALRHVGIRATSASSSRRCVASRGLRAVRTRRTDPLGDQLACREAAAHVVATCAAAERHARRIRRSAGSRRAPTASIGEAATQRPPECCTSQAGTIACSTLSPACGALPCSTVALVQGCARAAPRARRAADAQAAPFSFTSTLGPTWPRRRRCVGAAAEAARGAGATEDGAPSSWPQGQLAGGGGMRVSCCAEDRARRASGGGAPALHSPRPSPHLARPGPCVRMTGHARLAYAPPYP